MISEDNLNELKEEDRIESMGCESCDLNPNYQEVSEDNKEKNEKLRAVEFMNSMRGQYIVSQALVKAVKVMNEVEENRREFSNIEDMEYLIKHLFPICRMLELNEDLDYLDMLKLNDELEEIGL